MFQSTTSFDKDFSHLEEFSTQGYTHVPKIPTKIQADQEERATKIATAEATLNWQTENALAQNSILRNIDSKVDQIDSKVSRVEAKAN